MGADIPTSDIEIPEQLRYLLELFKSIRFSRIPNGEEFSLMPRDSLGYNDIDFYSSKLGLDLEIWEVDTILSLNAIFDRAIN